MTLRAHDPPAPCLFGYDPVRDLPPDHFARLVEIVVEEALPRKPRTVEPEQPGFDRRLCAKALVYGYADRSALFPATGASLRGEPALSVPHAGRHAKRRRLKVAKDTEILEAARQRFGAPEHVERYHHRAEAVETVRGWMAA